MEMQQKQNILTIVITCIMCLIVIWVCVAHVKTQRQKYFQMGINYAGKKVYDTIKKDGSVDLSVGNDKITLVPATNGATFSN